MVADRKGRQHQGGVTLRDSRFDRIETGLSIFDLTRFLHANRAPLRLKNAPAAQNPGSP